MSGLAAPRPEPPPRRAPANHDRAGAPRRRAPRLLVRAAANETSQAAATVGTPEVPLRLRLVAHVHDAHSGAVLALAAVDAAAAPGSSSTLAADGPVIISSSMDKTVARWRWVLGEEGCANTNAGVLQQTGRWEPSDAPWWAMQADATTSRLYTGTHARTVVAQDLATLAPLTGRTRQTLLDTSSTRMLNPHLLW